MMKKGVSGLIAVFLTAFTLNAAVIYWDGGGDGSSWDDANNWNPDQVPTTSDDARVEISPSATTDLIIYTNDQNHKVNSLTLTHPSGQENDLSLVLTPGTSSPPILFKVNENITLNGNTGPGQAKIHQHPYTQIWPKGVTLSGSSKYSMDENSVLTVNTNLKLDGVLNGPALFDTKGKIIVAGTLSLSGTNSGYSSALVAGFSQDGNSEVQVNTLVLGGSANDKSKVSYTVNSGTLQAQYIYLETNGIGLNAEFNQRGGTVKTSKLVIGQGRPSDITGQVLYSLTSGELTSVGDEYIGSYMDSPNKGNAKIFQSGGKNTVEGDLYIGPVSGHIGARQSSYQTTSGDVLVKGNLYINANQYTFSSMFMVGDSEVIIEGDTHIGTDSNEEQRASFYGLSTSKFATRNLYVGGSFSTKGQMKVSRDGEIRVYENGRLTLEEATLAGGTIINEGKTSLREVLLRETNIENKGKLYASGSASGTDAYLINDGKMYIGGDTSTARFQFQGDLFNQGAMMFTLLGTEYDYLEVSGKAQLGGEIIVSIPDGQGFDLAVGSIFDIIYAGQGLELDDDFSILLPQLDEQRKLEWSYDQNHLYLEVKGSPQPNPVVPEPTSSSLLLIGLLSVGAARRFKVPF